MFYTYRLNECLFYFCFILFSNSFKDKTTTLNFRLHFTNFRKSRFNNLFFEYSPPILKLWVLIFRIRSSVFLLFPIHISARTRAYFKAYSSLFQNAINFQNKTIFLAFLRSRTLCVGERWTISNEFLSLGF